MASAIRDLPPELREFWRLFSSFSYRYDYNNVWNDYLIMCVNFFANGAFIKERDQALKKYSKEEKQILNKMFYEMFSAINQILKSKEWFDFFGSIYEICILSRNKQQGAGQFFTPPNLCDMLCK